MIPIVHTHISGSRCVVQLTADWEHYIDVRPLHGYELDNKHGYDTIEIVRRGHVRERHVEHVKDAPERIIKLLKEAA